MNLTIPERSAARRALLFLALVGAAGQFAGYANPFGQFPPAALLLPACVFASARIAWGGWSAFYTGWLAGTLGFAASLYWIAVPIHDFGGLPWVVGALCVLALAGVLGLYSGLFSLACRHLAPLPTPLVCVAAGLTWGALEWLRGWLFTGFPWISLSTSFVPWPIWIQGASLFGAYGLSALLATAACLIVGTFPPSAGPFRTPWTRRLPCALLFIALVGALWAWGVAAIGADTDSGAPYRAALIQGNVNQDQKWEARYQKATVERYLSLSEAAVDPSLGKVTSGVDAVIWPETAMPFYFEDHRELADLLREWTERSATPLVFGAPGKSGREGATAYHNRVWLLKPDGTTDSHDKVHLVPFGEYVPLSIPLPFVDYFLEGLDFSPGESGKVLDLGKARAGVLICYEAIFPELSRELTRGKATLFINVSNDAWFGRSAAPLQHLHLTAMRAVESNRHILRATNTGYTAHIDNKGRIRNVADWFRPLAMVSEARILEQVTVYHRWYTAVTGLLVALPLLALAWSVWRRKSL